VTYPELQQAYEFFNRRLFGGTLPDVLITLAIKSKRTRGFYWPERFENAHAETTAAEIAINPEIMRARTDRETLSTLVQEMVHCWQYAYGNPSRSGYHNREWAEKMDAVGLTPSDTGEPSGKRTGQRVSHYIRDGGPFDRLCGELLDSGFRITWKAVEPPEKPKKKSDRVKYHCSSCEVQAWAKPGIAIACEDCEQSMVQAEVR
jgi:hypothetical protein